MPDTRHTVWSDPGEHRTHLRELSDDPVQLADELEEFVIHHAVARQLGFGVPAPAEGDRGLRHLSRLLGAAVARDSRSLPEHRDLPDYLYVTCRDFALFAVAALRDRGISARLRAGFANYFRAEHWEDHYVCEYRPGNDWIVLDARLGRRAREGLKPDFNVADVPRGRWQPAAAIWHEIRSGRVDPLACGYAGAGLVGEWWVAASVLRDAAALAGIECLPWDVWGPALSFRNTKRVTPEQAVEIDALAYAVEPAPYDRTEGEAVLARFAWAAPTHNDLATLRSGSPRPE